MLQKQILCDLTWKRTAARRWKLNGDFMVCVHRMERERGGGGWWLGRFRHSAVITMEDG